MADEGKTTEPNAASTTAPPPGKDGVDVTAAASGAVTVAGADVVEQELDGEDDAEQCPKVSGGSNKESKLNSALTASRTPYAKPAAAKDTPMETGEDAVTQNKRVYVGNLSWSVTWRDLKDHMRSAGEVTRADVLQGYDGRSKGCGIVEYATVEEANTAVETLNDSELMGRQIFAREDREEKGANANSGGGASGGAKSSGSGSGDGKSVYVGNLAYEVAWQDLKDHMRSAGDVLHAEVMTMHDGRSKGCGIVEFATPDGAKKAIAELNDTELQGRNIFVREDRERGGAPNSQGGQQKREGDGGYQGGWQQQQHQHQNNRGGGGGGRGGNNYGNLSVYVGNLAYETSWQDLKDHMRAAGNVDKADVLKSDDGRSKGCGIVLYQKSHEAARAIRELQNTELNGRPIFVREDREQGGGGGGGGYHQQGGGGGGGGGYHNKYYQQHHQQHQQSMPGPPAGQGCQLYVGNIAWETGWRELKDYFRQCGDVDRAEAIEGRDGRKKGFGFIRYSNPNDAQNAINTLNGVEFMGRNLEVRLDNKV